MGTCKQIAGPSTKIGRKPVCPIYAKWVYKSEWIYKSIKFEKDLPDFRRMNSKGFDQERTRN